MNYEEIVATSLKNILGVDEVTFETPKDKKFGDFAYPCFLLSKERRQAPHIIAQELATEFNEKEKSGKIKAIATGPYLNFKIDNESFVKETITNILEKKDKYGSNDKRNETIVIDYSSPNVAKNMGIHNLRSTIIGQSLCNIYRFLGYEVAGVNHLGDWGTQFGKLIWALEQWSNPEELKEKGIIFLNDMYVKFHDEAEHNPAMEDEARAWFKKIEQGDEKAHMWWKLFIDISLEDYQKLFDRLHIKFTHTTGESFYMQFLEDTLKRLEEAKLTSTSEGAEVIAFEESENMPPLLLKKSDGATLYGTRDLAAAFYRLKEFNPVKILYVVDIAQALHFKQVFKVLETLDEKNKDIFEHVQFGRLSFPDASMSTRKGNIIPLREVLDKARDKIKAIIEEKNPDLEDKDTVAEQVGVGAIIFGDLIHNRVHNIIFEWDKILDFQGETGPYVQYTIARINSILRKENMGEIDYSLLANEDEKHIASTLSNFSNVIAEAGKQARPHHIAKYVIELSQAFNNYYVRNKIIQEDKNLQSARLALISSIKEVLATGLKLLGIESPERM